MEWLFGKLEKQWGVVRDAPIPFFAAVTLLVVAVWFAMDWRYDSQIKKKDASINALHSTIVIMRERLDQQQGGLKKEDVQKTAKNSTMWWLGEKKMGKLHRLLRRRDEKYSFRIFPLFPNASAYIFGADLRKIFEANGWEADIISPNWVGPNVKGLLVVISDRADPKRPPIGVGALKDILSEIGIRYREGTEQALKLDEFGLVIGQPPTE